MKKINSILVIAGAKGENKNFLKEEAKKYDFILALDSGADTALEAGFEPDLALGDLDSVSEEAKAKLGKEKLFKISRQDNTDLEKGLSFCKVIKPQKVTIVCLSGGRLDFTLSNFLTLFNFIRNFEIEVKSDAWRIYPLRKSGIFEAVKGAKVSLIPLTPIKDITLKGLKYGLKNDTLKVGQLAVSNTAVKEEISIDFKSGKLLLMIYNP
ncbi:MAG: thiamine diphosphokinase [Elusimicrobiaceae bacterium]|nr:thiamine diphosphokinase [Elusimicrobiota bacterium]